MDASLFGYSLEDFRDEAAELLQKAEAIIGEMSASPGDPEKINALFRAIHSLKGSAAYAGMAHVNSFAHLCESFLGDLRSSRSPMDDRAGMLLVRARDYLEDLIFSPDSTPPPVIDEALPGPMERLSAALGMLGEKKEPIKPASPPPAPAAPLPSAPPASPAKNPAATVTLSTTNPSEMSENDVIKATLIKGLKAIAACLKKSVPDYLMLEKVLKKLGDTVLWAFGDGTAAMKEITDMEDIVASGMDDEAALRKLRALYNALSASLREEMLSLGGGAPQPEEETRAEAAEKESAAGQERERAPADRIRGASEDDIVLITITKTLGTISAQLGDERPDRNQIRKMLGRLADINRWALHDDGRVASALTRFDDYLRRPFDERVREEMKEGHAALRSLFTLIAGAREEEEEKPPSEAALPVFPDRFEGPSNSPTRLRPQQQALRAPLQAGPSLRVRSEDIDALMQTVGSLKGLDAKTLEGLQAQAIQLRMVPVGELFTRFRKVVRDLSEETGKEIDLHISGESVRLDKSIADRLQEPILHMVRNAAGHGIETPEEREAADKGGAVIALKAYPSGGQVVIEVSDNGRGISRDAVRRRGEALGLLKEGAAEDDQALLALIFRPGFSTREAADGLSGRGVGMDVVKEAVSALQGSVTVESREGEGTRFRIVLPLTLAIVNALIVDDNRARIALPAATVERVVSLTEEEISAGSFMARGRLCLDLKDEGEVIPLVRLEGLFGRSEKKGKRCVVLLRYGPGHKIALVADAALGRKPLVVKPLDRFAQNRYFSSASMVDGELVLVLNVGSLLAA